MRVASLLESYIFGIARGEIADRSEVLRTGMSRDDYWEARASFWGTYFDAARYPTTLATWEARRVRAPAPAPTTIWRFALELILDSVQRMIAAADDLPNRRSGINEPSV